MYSPRPLPDVKTVMLALKRMSNESGNFTARHRHYSFQSIKRDYPEQFITPDDTLTLPPVNIVVRKMPVKTIIESEKKARIIEV